MYFYSPISSHIAIRATGIHQHRNTHARNKRSSNSRAESRDKHPANRKCQFCAAFFIDVESYAEYTDKCVARLSALLTTYGRVKFVSVHSVGVRDDGINLSRCRYAATSSQYSRCNQDQLHKYPGGFGCTVCSETFLTETNRIRRTEDVQ